MIENIEKNIVAEIRALYEEDEVAQRFFDWVSERKNDSAETSLDRIASRLNLNRGEAVTLAKRLQKAMCGRFIVGRKGAKSRVHWTYSLRSLGLVAKGSTDKLDDVDPDIAAEVSEQNLANVARDTSATISGNIEHNFKLRVGMTITFLLPVDFTNREAERLAAFIQSLPFET